jgi:hypothetical protein
MALMHGAVDLGGLAGAVHLQAGSVSVPLSL